MTKRFACEFVHFALGSSAGTENDTWVSARIKIFMMTVRTNLITKLMGRKILLVTMMTTVTQKYFPNDCTTFPLNFLALPLDDGNSSRPNFLVNLKFLISHTGGSL